MSRSNPPRSNIAERVRQSSLGVAHTSTHDHPSTRRKLGIRVAALMRWLHIYLSMFGLAAVLFFSITGVTLNHPDWFFGEADKSVQNQGQMDQKWFHLKVPAHSSDEPTELSRQVAKLEVVEHLRKSHGIRGALADFKVDELECVVTFKGPGYAADAFIERDSGRYQLTQSFHGFVAIINDLHKGRDTGKIWSLVIDLSAVVMTIISVTGLILLFYLKRRRIPGLIVSLVGTIVVVLVFLLWVP
jgi:uncharacterized protein